MKMQRHSVAALWIALVSTGTMVTGQSRLVEMEPYGTLSLVDDIDCAVEPSTHGFADNPAGASRIETILGRPCRVMPTVSDESSTMTYTIGTLKLLRPGAVYVLTVEYPEDAPRSMVIVNNGNEVARGFHTGLTLGDALHSKYVGSLPESLGLPLSGKYETWSLLIHLHDRFAVNGLIRGSRRPRTQSPKDGFQVAIAQWSTPNAPVSRGVAVSRIRLFEVVNPDELVQPLKLPPKGLPRRRVFWREEMSDGVIGGKKPEDRGLDDFLDWYRHKARLMRFLGINTYAKDLLEFGANQGWDSSPHGGNAWVHYNAAQAHYWEAIVRLMGERGLDILPYYEYAGSRGDKSLGYQRRCKPLTRDDAYSHIAWVERANADITDPETHEDFRKMLELTVVQMRDKATFVGAWLRHRSQMPVGFGPTTLSRFSDEVNDGKTITREHIKADPALYSRYIAWWQTKRRDFFVAMRDYLRQNGIDNALILYSGQPGEPGVGFGDWTRRFVTDSPDVWKPILARDEHRPNPGRSAWEILSPVAVVDRGLYLKGLLSPGLDWGGWETRHRVPADDPDTYRDVDGVLLAHAFNRSYTALSPRTLDAFRSPSGLFIVRHYCLNENMMFDHKDQSKLGYFVADIERSGPYCMAAEALAVANGDPTMIGYLTGNSLGVGFPTYVRTFNANFLSLPALPSRIVARGASTPTVVVRRIDTEEHGLWLAVVNTDPHPKPGTTIRLPKVGNVTDAVTGETLPTARGKLDLDLYPYELRSLHID